VIQQSRAADIPATDEHPRSDTEGQIRSGVNDVPSRTTSAPIISVSAAVAIGGVDLEQRRCEELQQERAQNLFTAMERKNRRGSEASLLFSPSRDLVERKKGDPDPTAGRWE